MTNTTALPIDAELRAAARKRLEARAGAWRFLALWIVLSLLCAGIWAVTTPSGYFWPVWPALGVGIGVGFTFLGAYGSSRITEDRVDAEIARMRR